MEIVIANKQNKVPLRIPQIEKIVKIILQTEEIKDVNLSLVFVSRQKIQALNKKYLSRSYATDVLAFDLSEGKELCGEIIISTDAALKSINEYGTSLAQELSLYVIHGILHLLGYDDHAKKDVERMRRKEQKVLKLLGNNINSILK